MSKFYTDINAKLNCIVEAWENVCKIDLHRVERVIGSNSVENLEEKILTKDILEESRDSFLAGGVIGFEKNARCKLAIAIHNQKKRT